jgi:hypothetical protein
MISSAMRALPLALALLAGCAAPTTAVIDGRTVARPNLGYTDRRFYAVNHQRAYPDAHGPVHGLHNYDGRIVGEVCGLDVNFESEYWGRRLDVSGFISRRLPGGRTRHARFDVRNRGDERAILGNIGGRTSPVEIHFKPGSIVGTVGVRRFQLDQLFPEEDQLRGTVTLQTWEGWQKLPFVVNGIAELRAMPAADQAVLMSFMMSCLEGVPGPGRSLDPVLSIDFRNSAGVAER